VPDFDATALLEEYGDPDLVQELAQLLVETAPPQVEAVRSAVVAGDAVALRAAAHRLRGSLLAFGVPAAIEAATRLEAMGSAGNLTGAEQWVQTLATHVQGLLDDAQAWLKRDASSPHP
jgi:HPt (histidine-containing phosphotransfer) domain-containing protein